MHLCTYALVYLFPLAEKSRAVRHPRPRRERFRRSLGPDTFDLCDHRGIPDNDSFTSIIIIITCAVVVMYELLASPRDW